MKRDTRNKKREIFCQTSKKNHLRGMRKFIVLTIVFFIAVQNFAASVDTVEVYSNAMHKEIKCVVIKPASYKKKNKLFPVVYLLHGYSGNYSNWVALVPQIKNYADDYQLIIVCPDGGFSSWYFDSPIDSSMKYETYIGTEIPLWIDAHYRTNKNRKARAITGLSMGGHGGLFLGFRHADIFGACGSMSGGVDLNSSHSKFDISLRIGDTIKYAKNWTDYSVINIVNNYPKDSLKIIIDCGTEDFFYDINASLHKKLLQLHIPHDYIERPGEHNWNYWSNAVQYQLLFFHNYFLSANKK